MLVVVEGECSMVSAVLADVTKVPASLSSKWGIYWVSLSPLKGFPTLRGWSKVLKGLPSS